MNLSEDKVNLKTVEHFNCLESIKKFAKLQSDTSVCCYFYSSFYFISISIPSVCYYFYFYAFSNFHFVEQDVFKYLPYILIHLTWIYQSQHNEPTMYVKYNLVNKNVHIILTFRCFQQMIFLFHKTFSQKKKGYCFRTFYA